jgi:hypothetical protein
MELLLIALIVGILAAFAVMASELGVDSRDRPEDTHTHLPYGAH